MKKITAFFFSVAACLLTTNSASAQIPTNGLIAFYPFQGSVSDASGNERHGVATAITYGTDASGKLASSAVFTRGSAVDIPSFTGLQFRPITYSLWVYLSGVESNSQTVLIGRKQAWNGEDGGLCFDTRSGKQNELQYHTGNTAVVAGLNLALGQWYHIVFTQDTNSQASFYVNGELLVSQLFTAAQTATSFPFRLGADSALTGITTGEGLFNGKMDSVRIYNRALSAQEVASLYTSELDTTDSDIDGLYDFLEAQIGTDPNNPDTDGDGLKDGAEYLLEDLGFDPLVPNGEQMDSLFVPSFYPSIEIFAPASTALKISLGGVDTVSTNSLPAGWVFNTSTKQMSGVLSGITSSSGQMTGGKTNGLNLPVTFNFHPQNRQTIAKFTRIAAKRVNAPPFVVLPPIASSGLPVTLTVKSGPATISSNNVVTIIGAGTVVITANQAGNNNFLQAPEVTTSFRVTR